MDTSDIISLAAFGISLIALWISWLTYRRDRGHLKIVLDFKAQTNAGSAYMVKATEHRPQTDYHIQVIC